MHITYTGGGKYANAARSYRLNGKVKKEYIHLGKVVDSEKGIYDNKEIGLVGFDLEKGEFFNADLDSAPRLVTKEKLILDFGDAYFLDWYIRDRGFMNCIDKIDVPELDTLRSLILYYIVSGNAIDHALDWYSGSYANLLYPAANMDGRRISEFYEYLGEEKNYRAFFSSYIQMVTKGQNSVKVIIDSTGLPNDIDMNLTAINNHNGDINNEVRLILVMDMNHKMPLFIRYVPGNIVDSNTLIRTIKELEQQGVNCTYAILDAGYPTKANLKGMYESNIGFMSRLESGSLLYKNLRKEHLPNMSIRENYTMYGERRLYVKMVECDLIDGCSGYAYCVLDLDRKNLEDSILARKAFKNGLSSGEAYDSMTDTGFFIIISNMKLNNDEVLPNYYIRQNIEQFFDVGKGSASLLPLRVHSESTFRGHLLASFIAAAIEQSLQNELNELGKVKKQGPERRIGSKSPNLISAIMELRNQKCKVYEESILPGEPQPKANAVYNLFGLGVPFAIPKLVCSHKM